MTSPAADSPTAAPSVSGGLRRVQGPWAAVLVGALCYLNSIGNGFTYDDVAIIQENPRVRNPLDYRAIWLSDWWLPQDSEVFAEFNRRDRLYRPLAMQTFAVEYSIFGLWPAAFHATNILLHAAACGLVWVFVRRLLGDIPVAAAAALLFAVHPIHCEAVANIVGRAEVLATLGILAGCLLLMRSGVNSGPNRATVPPLHGEHGPPARANPPNERTPASSSTVSAGRALAAAVCFLAALFSKETAICYAPVAAIAVWHYRRRHAAAGDTPAEGALRAARGWLATAAILLLPLAAYLPLRYVALDQHLLRDQAPHPAVNPLVESSPLRRPLDAGTVLGHYVRLLVAPSALSSNYGYAVIDPRAGTDPLAILGLAAGAALLAALAGLRRPAGEVAAALGVCAALFIVSYALISNTVLLIGVSVAERLMYWPSVPALALIAVAAIHIWRRHCSAGGALQRLAPALRIAAWALLAALLVRSVFRNMDWESNARLFAEDSRNFPKSAHLVGGHAAELFNAGLREKVTRERLRLFAEAADRAAAALAIMPTDASSMRVRGLSLHYLGRTDEALAVLDAAMLLNPQDRRLKSAVAEVRAWKAGSQPSGSNPVTPPDERIAALQAAVAAAPSDVAARVAYGRALLEAGRHRAALEQLETAARLAPESAEVLEALGEALMTTEQLERARDVYQRLLQISPSNWKAHANLTVMLSSLDAAASLRHAREAHRINPSDFRVNVNLAEALAANQRVDEALALYERIRDGLPASEPIRAAIESRIDDLRRAPR